MRIICIEGLDGTGKETMANALYRELLNREYNVRWISFPQYHSIMGLSIKEMLSGTYGEAPMLDKELISPLYTLDRIGYFKENLEDLMKLDYLILDRGFYSNFMYQASKLGTIDVSNINLQTGTAHKGAMLIDDYFVQLTKWLTTNYQWEFSLTMLAKAESIHTVVLTLSEEDRQEQIKSRYALDTNERNEIYLNNCRKFVDMMLDKRFQEIYFEWLADNYDMCTWEDMKKAYFDNVIKFVITHASSEDDIEATVQRDAKRLANSLSVKIAKEALESKCRDKLNKVSELLRDYDPSSPHIIDLYNKIAEIIDK